MDCNKNEALQANEVAETFWTSCNRCNIQFEYEKIYVKRNLLCRCCKQPFSAIEISAPVAYSHGSRPWPFSPFRHAQQDVPSSSSGPKSVANLAKRTLEASSKGLKRRNKGPSRNNGAPTKSSSTIWEKVEANEGLSRNNGAPTKNSSAAPEKVEVALVSAPSAMSRSVKQLTRVEIRRMLHESAKKDMITVSSRHN